MMIFQSFAVGESCSAATPGWQVQRRDDGGVPRDEVIRKYALPTFVGIPTAVSAYVVSLPSLLWMPGYCRLSLAIPIGMLSSTAEGPGGGRPDRSAPRSRQRRQRFWSAPMVGRAVRNNVAGPLQDLRSNPGLLKAHLMNRPAKPAIAAESIRICDRPGEIRRCREFRRSAGYLDPHETFAILNSEANLRALLELPAARTV